MVKAEDGTLHITTGADAGNINITGGSVKYIARVANTTYVGKAIKDNAATGNDSGSALTGDTLELGENLYLGDLRKYEGVTDEFGRPATQWVYKNSEIGTYAETARATFVGKVTVDTIYNTIGRSIVSRVGSAVQDPDASPAPKAPKLYAYIDGVSQDDQTYSSVAAWANRNDNTAAGDSGVGTITEVFVDENDNVYIAQHAIYVMQATNNYNSSKDTLSVAMRTRPAGAKSVNTLDGRDFDLAGYANEDYILYTYANAKVQTIAKAEVLTGTVNSYSKSGTKAIGKATGWVKLDGQQYNYAKFAETNADNGSDVEYGLGEQAAVVLDGMNNVLWVDNKAIASGNYLYISEMATATRLGTTLIAEANFTDGTRQEITIARINDKSHDNDTKNVKGAVGSAKVKQYNGWYSYSKNDNNEYTLTAAQTSAAVSYLSGATTAKKVVENGKVAFLNAATSPVTDNTTAAFAPASPGPQGKFNGGYMVPGTTGIRGNANTIFLVNDKDNELKVYTGIASVPDVYTSTVASRALDVAYMNSNDSNKSSYASLVYIDASNATVDDTNTAYDLMFLLNNGETYRDSNDQYTLWKTVTNGEEKNDVESKIGTSLTGKTMYYKVKTDSKGYVSATKFDAINTAGTAYKLGNLDGVEAKGDTLILSNDGEFLASGRICTLIVYAPELQWDETPDNTGYEVYTSLTAAELVNHLTGKTDYTASGEWYAVTTTKDSGVLKSLYVVVRSAGGSIEEVPSGSNSDSGIKGLDDGVYTPTAPVNDMIGNGEDNLILKYTAVGSGSRNITLSIKDSDGTEVYKEVAAVSGDNWNAGTGHFFFIYKWGHEQTTASPGWNENLTGVGEGVKGEHGFVPGAVYTYTIKDGTVDVTPEKNTFVA